MPKIFEFVLNRRCRQEHGRIRRNLAEHRTHFVLKGFGVTHAVRFIRYENVDRKLSFLDGKSNFLGPDAFIGNYPAKCFHFPAGADSLSLADDVAALDDVEVFLKSSLELALPLWCQARGDNY